MNAFVRHGFRFLKPLVNRYVGFLLLLFGYMLVAQKYGGLPAATTAWRLEIPLVLYLFYYLNRITRRSRWQFLLTAVPIFLMYAVFDVYHLLLGRLLRLAEVSELPEMMQVIHPGLKILLVLLLGFPLVALLWSTQWRRYRPLLLGALPLLAMVVAVEGYPAFFMRVFTGTQREIDWLSDTVNAGTNGRISMALYNEARRRVSLEKTVAYRGDSSFQQTFDQVAGRVNALRSKGNVHLIALESFVDPNLLRGVRFSRNPVHPAFATLFSNKGGLTVSPVFGGATAQAEFEMLCGVPAMRELSGIEFDVFTGAKTLCLPNILTHGGYHTVASNAFLPDFFNSTNAYEGMGFENIYYPIEYAPGRDTYLGTGDVTGEAYMFDGDLFTQNLAFVAQWIKENPGRPIFNYIMSIYGHTPHDLNLDKRPKVVEMLGDFRDEQLERVANQYYYRTEALAKFVKDLMRIDPKSIVILVSDHLPSLTYGPNTYSALDYLGKTEDYIHLNRIYIVENGRVVHYDTIHHYDIPRIILSYVTHTKFDQKGIAKGDSVLAHHDPTDYRAQYMAIMANAMQGQSFFSALGFLSSSDKPVPAPAPEPAITGPPAGL
ncbi:MAG: sulfatase-like hydrolase/transferase [Deltaproteobacteria bacterium]|nr:sulfatase-like hydrolase/transferase [Deltaproteobacteria bacterium]NCP96985.1 sulfatase-like hydrolase/transferase [Deltaproteobacteria bacterium]NCS74073.1 sulfatase-like hydrolase/transferase [Deltaproteobacteria bacterium]OIP67463.1 MAG: hypothetical protein AUK30_00595 [Nitrospirae bacterium CG2_30_70_394]